VNRESGRVDRDQFLSVVKVPVPSRAMSGRELSLQIPYRAPEIVSSGADVAT